MITLVAVSNPFQPAMSRAVHEVEWREGITLADVLDAAGVPTLRHACVIDGLAVPEEVLAGYLLHDGVTVISMPSVAGGGFGKMFAEIAVMAAATAITATTFGGGLVAMLASGTALSDGAMQSIVVGAISIGGNMLINAFMGNSAGGADSNSFNPTGPKTIASGGTPIPKGYGTFQSGGNIIASYVAAEGIDNYLNVLVSYGWGQASSITNVTINGNPIADYVNATYMARLGTNDQTVIPYFNNIVNGYPQDIRAVALAGTIDTGANPGTPVIIQGTGTATQGLQVVMQFPDGVFYQNDDGSLRSLSIAYQIMYSISGENNWISPVIPNQTTDLIRFADDGTVEYAPGWVVVPTDGNSGSGVIYAYDNNTSPTAYTPGQAWTGTQTVTYYNADGSSYTGPITLNGEWQVCDPSLNQQVVDNWWGGYIIFTDANQGTLYHTTNIYNLPPNKYDVQVTKYGSAFAGDPIQPLEANNDRTGDQTWVYSVNEVQYQDLSYPNMVLVGVRALATDQISGANITVNADVVYETNVTMPSELSSYGMDNPAVVAYDMLVNDFYGGGVSASSIDTPAFAAWAAYNDELVSDGFGNQIKRHVFNGVFDSQGTNLWKSLQKVAMMSQACIVQVGQNYSVVVDVPVTVPAQVFTSANVLKDSIKDTWLSFDDRANRIEVTFPDSARNYRTDEPQAVMLPQDIQAGVPVKTTRVNLLGCTNRAQAWHWAYRKLMSTDLLLLSRSFDVGIEAVACQIGSVIGVQDDVTGWANGGRIRAGSTTTSLVVDVDGLAFTAGEGYTVSIVHPVVVLGTAEIVGITGNLITFTSNPPTSAIGIDNPAGAVTQVQAVGSQTITVASAYGFSVGDTVTFFNEDVVDTQPVSALSGNVLTPYAPFLQAPTVDSSWVYGQSAGAFPAKLFTVTNIRKKGDLQVSIDSIQYVAAVYSDDTPIITETLGTPDSNAAVTNLTANEQYVLASGANGGQASQIAVGWINGPNTVAVQIWVAQNDPNQALSAESLWQTVSKASTAVLNAPTGAILQIRAVGVDATGETASYSTAPVVTITVQGSGLAPGDVTGFTGNYQSTETVLTWAAATNAANYEIRYNADASNNNWQAGTLLWSGSALTWADTTIRGGLYMIKALTAQSVESVNLATFSLDLTSTSLNGVGGVAPSEQFSVTVTVEAVNSDSAAATVTVPLQTITRADGSTLTLGSADGDELLAYSNLALDTTYYVYTYVLAADPGKLHAGGGDPPTLPSTTPSTINALLCCADGCIQGPAFSFTTPSTTGGGTSTTSTGVCPDGRELVITRERGEVAVATLLVGEYVLGQHAGRDCWKEVRRIAHREAEAWYRVRGYRMSPLDPVWFDGEWRMPYEVGEVDLGPGVRVMVEVNANEYDNQNYYLAGRGERLLIHNTSVSPYQYGSGTC